MGRRLKCWIYLKKGFKFPWRILGLYGGSILLLLWSIFPLIWMLMTSFKPTEEIFIYPPEFLPRHMTLTNFHALFSRSHFLSYFINSMKVSILTTACALVLSVLGAYGLVRFRFRGKELLAQLVLLTYLFAPIMIIIPFYILIRKIGLVNTHTALVLALTSFSLPFTLWLLRSFFQTIPLELEEAALVDGATHLQAAFYIVLPLAAPGIIATAIFTLILAWNDYIFARILITSDPLKTLPVGVQDLFNQTVVDWGMIMASGVLITIPVLLFFIFIQQYLIEGWGAGGIKG
ncbi:MAG TPA: carbohydrate ABC transporter permease [Candidatus Limnocylindrales bacterium]|nr:carbohydrate ABC transporter permease [Candidatus Limnocylindrales bacterium]